MGEGGISTIDVSNPRKPVIVHNEDNELTQQIREAHGWSFRGDIACLQADSGVQFWNFENPLAPERISYLRVKRAKRGDYDHSLWWSHWQGRYVYAGVTSHGISILDAQDPSDPKYVKTIPTNQTGGFRVGSVHAIGNVLIATGFDDGPSGVSIFDISDPVNPNLLATFAEISSYAALVNGNKLVLSARQRPRDGAVVYDISDPSSPKRIGKPHLQDSVGGGGYVGFDGGYAFTGRKAGFFKYDLSHPDIPLVMSGSSGAANVDEGFPTPLGNIVFSGNDIRGAGSALIPHQTGRDVVGPIVNMVVPRDGATNQALTSRIGLTFTDYLDGLSIDSTTIIIRPIGGEALKGYYTNQTGIVNFHPLEPLLPNMTYEVIVPSGGVRDYVGNPGPTEFRSTFSTGSSIRDCRLEAPVSAMVGDTSSFSLLCQGLGDELAVWDFGDGGLPDTVSIHAVRKRSFDKSGVYKTVVGVPALGKSLVTQIMVLTPPTARRSTHASTLLLDTAAGILWNVNTDNNSITMSSAASLSRIREIAVGGAPRTLARSPDGEIWVANQRGATLSIVGPSGELRGTVTLPRASRPFGVAINAQGNRAYVTLEATGEIMAIDREKQSVLQRVKTVPTPRGIAISGDGTRVLVTRFISDSTRGEVAEHDGETLALKRIIPLQEDFTPDTDNSGAGVPNALSFIAISPDGGSAWVPFKKDNVRRGLLNPALPLPLNFENTVRTGIAYLDLELNQERKERRADLDNRSLANSVTFSRLGGHAFVTTGASNHTVLVSPVSGKVLTAIEPAEISRELWPDGAALGPKDSLLFLHYALSREIGVYDVSEAGTTNFLRKIKTFSTIGTDSLPPDILRGKQVFHNANDPRMSKDNYMSCAVCHMDGGSDRRIWDFTDKGEGRRRTISLIGRGGMGHGPLHWTANFDEIQDFEQDIRNHFGGLGFISDEQYHGRAQPLGEKKAGQSAELDALAAYIATLNRPLPSPFRAENGSLTQDALAGRAIFHDNVVGCSACHVPGKYTNSGLNAPIRANAYSTFEGYRLFDVGTQKAGSGKRLGQSFTGLDTPTLLGVWEGGPYLHDGSARTLMDVITTHNPDDRHGKTSHLSQREKEQLVAFLQQIEGASDESLPTAAITKSSIRISHRKVDGTHIFRVSFPDPQSLEILSTKGRVIARMTAKASHEGKYFLWNGAGTDAKLGAGIYHFRIKDAGGSEAATSLFLRP